MPLACPAWVPFFHHEFGSPDDMQNFASGEAKFCNPFVLQAPNKPPAHMPAQRFKVQYSGLGWWKGFGRARLSLREIPA